MTPRTRQKRATRAALSRRPRRAGLLFVVDATSPTVGGRRVAAGSYWARRLALLPWEVRRVRLVVTRARSA